MALFEAVSTSTHVKAVGNHELELLAVTLMDIRATVESMRRTVTNAQADIERLRHGRDVAVLDDLKRCVAALAKETDIVIESAGTLTAPLTALYDQP